MTCSTLRGQPTATTPAPALLDEMDGQRPNLRPLFPATTFHLVQHTIDRTLFRFGSGAERIQVRGPAGRSAQLVYQLPPAPVIQELAIQADVVTNRAGLQLAAKVVLPRSINPETRRPFELLVRSGKLAAGGGWEVLSLQNLPQLLANHARVARAKHSSSLDERGAFVSQIVFLTPGGTGVTDVVVDRVRVYGVVKSQWHGTQTDGPKLVDAQPNQRQASSVRELFASPGRATVNTRPNVSVPRIIQWQGEPFEQLQRLGFNTIALDQLPTDEQLDQAERLRLALFCPPPGPDDLVEHGIAPKFNSVLAWNLGQQLSAEDLDHVERWEKLVARHDPATDRPTVLAPELHTLEASRITDVVRIGRPVVGTELTVREHTAWLSQRQRLARPGTPMWLTVETQPSARQKLQMAALGRSAPPASATSYSQLTLLMSASFGIKSRGFYFSSQEPLTAEDDATRQRAAAIELTNLRLQLVEPWLSAGKEVSSARSTQTDLSALVMQAERSNLLVPVWWSQDMQSTTHPREAGPVSFVIPGVAESSEAFLVTLGGIERVRHKRVTGGVRVSLESLPPDGFVLLSDDPRAIAHITRYLQRIAPRSAKLRRDLAYYRLQEASALVARLQSATTAADQFAALLQNARSELAASDRFLSAKNFQFAYLRADGVDLVIDQLEKTLEDSAGLPRPLTTTAVSYGPIGLSERIQLQNTLARAPLSQNVLTGGGFENLSAMLQRGWRHKQLPIEGITSAVRLSPEAPHSGSYCLELEARAIDEQVPATVVPTAPVWITSAPVQVSAGDLIEITGVARLVDPLVGSVDGLQIIDSLGGTDMALRIQQTPTWQPFRLIRAAASDAQLTVTLALSGLGKAQVDDVAVRVVKRP